MPAGDRTGPAGMGPMTGRGAGYCAIDYTNAVPRGGGGFGFGRGLGRRGGGRGFGRGFGFGAGQGWGQNPVPNAAATVAPTAEQELDALKQQSQYLSDTLKNIQTRIEELEKAK